jgi:hypothetical protein
MKIEHRVSLVGQITDNLCWLAAFQMLEGWYNHRLPKRPTAFTPTQLAHLKTLNWGVQPHAVGGFATLMGLTIKIAPPTLADVGDLLKTYGPLWYPGKNTGYLPVGTHHVVVLRGLAGWDGLVDQRSLVVFYIWILHQNPKFVAIDKEADDDIMHFLQLGETNGLANQPFDPRP